jgi:hypothetical protein
MTTDLTTEPLRFAYWVPNVSDIGNCLLNEIPPPNHGQVQP